LEAGSIGEKSDPRPRSVAGYDKPLLPAAVLYGANASGKSNVLSALSFMWEAVLYSQVFWGADVGIPRSPFAWGGRRTGSSTFEVLFLAGQTKYEYGFVVSDTAVEEEWLYAWPNERKQTWFVRDGQKFDFGDQFVGRNKLIEEVTRPNALFLSVGSLHQHSQLTPIYSWFRTILPFNIRDSGVELFDSRRLIFPPGSGTWPVQATLGSDPEELRTVWVRRLLEIADAGIVDVRVVNENGDGAKSAKPPKFLLKHQIDDEDSWLDLRTESHGTQAIFKMAPFIFRALENGGTLLVDELETSLHPLLGLAILQMFNDRETNPRNAQIIFTTHDTNLLGAAVGEPPLRRDQVWFTEKDKDGASKLYPLTDYKPRKAENLERGYLQGRYGAIPFLGDMAWVAK
jgi:hypothetical protein